MNSKDIYQNIKYNKIINKIDVKINNFSIDTRSIKDNDLYIGIKGENFDGNMFYMDAFKNGASIAILENIEETAELNKYLIANNNTVILVDDTVTALGDLAKYKRSLFKNPVVAITGSVGKTSTKDMIYSVLKEKFNAHKTIGNQNNHLGLPLSILSLDLNAEILVLEMGMNHLGEISYLTSIAKPDVAVITNVGTAHIGFLGSRENILKAKLEILEGLNENGTVIINNDNDLLHRWYLENKNSYNIKTFGIFNESDFKAINVEENTNGSSFVVDDKVINVPVGGEHFIYNALAALAVGNVFDIDYNKIQKGITNFELSRNRMNIINNELSGITIIDDSYNANFDSVKYGIKYLASQSGRKIAVIGTMGELGDYSHELHSNIGNVIYEEGIDVLITVREYTDLINERAVSLGFNKDNSFHFTNNDDAIRKINEIKQKGDKILVKASNSLKFKEIVEQIK